MEYVLSYKKRANQKDKNLGFYVIHSVSQFGISVFYLNLRKKTYSFVDRFSLENFDKTFQQGKYRSFEGIHYAVNSQNIEQILSEYFKRNSDLKSLLNLTIKKWLEISGTPKGSISILKKMVREKKTERREKMRLAKKKGK